MNPCATATVTLAFPRSSRPRQLHAAALSREPRVARHLALAHEVDRRVGAGELDDLAHAARAFGLTRAGVTQIASLTLLPPTIQVEFLAMPPVTVRRDVITERPLRPIVGESVWERQMAMWEQLRKEMT